MDINCFKKFFISESMRSWNDFSTSVKVLKVFDPNCFQLICYNLLPSVSA